ncbi:AraC family transcriptional regulator [Kiritimatiellaeota bacterium B1221]|nr:AraC family transcriptional regulator [Kiritimatiellaeota bacterium B1221]
MTYSEPPFKTDRVHFRDVVINGDHSQRLAYPIRMGIETRHRSSYGQKGATRTDSDPCCIFQYTLRGEGQFTDETGTQCLPPGTGFLCESHDPETAYAYPATGSEAWEFFYLNFNVDPLGPLVRVFGKKLGRVITLPETSSVMCRLLYLARIQDSILFLSAGEAASLVLDLISALAGAASGEPETKEDLLLKKVQTFIQSRLPEGRIDLNELAEALEMSRGNLCRFYRQKTGISPYQYILKKQMLLACQWMLEEQLTVKEVSARLGFSTPANFIRSFKQVTGLTTREFLSQGLLPQL